MRNKRILVLWDNESQDLRRAGELLLSGVSWLRRIREVLSSGEIGKGLDYFLRKLKEPRRAVFVAHGDREGVFLPGGQRAEADWWGDFDAETEVFGFSCKSLSTLRTLQGTHGRFRAICGFSDDIRFFVGSRKGKLFYHRILKGLGRVSSEIRHFDLLALLAMKEVYESAISGIHKSYSVGDGDRLSLLFLEEQLNGIALEVRIEPK